MNKTLKNFVKFAQQFDDLLLIIGLIIMGILIFMTNCFAMDTNKVKEYEGKIVLISYLDLNSMNSTIGKLIRVINRTDDFTLDKMYAYAVIIDSNGEVQNIGTRFIQYIEEIK
jgi:hypothetical protein